MYRRMRVSSKTRIFRYASAMLQLLKMLSKISATLNNVHLYLNCYINTHLLYLSITVKNVAAGIGIKPGANDGLLPVITKDYFNSCCAVTGIDNWSLADGEGQRIGRQRHCLPIPMYINIRKVIRLAQKFGGA